ncbi:translation initiation factor IF-2-like [Monodelphis domestica]|uniref:translation initiation factor IF-2-like n=1 Tax=Monodelphis domestica TaxID=13616 RepID=UPI0024E1C6D1|nr:translation initiation factor IF-2-like [Monodelphis domestica]
MTHLGARTDPGEAGRALQPLLEAGGRLALGHPRGQSPLRIVSAEEQGRGQPWESSPGASLAERGLPSPRRLIPRRFPSSFKASSQDAPKTRRPPAVPKSLPTGLVAPSAPGAGDSWVRLASPEPNVFPGTDAKCRERNRRSIVRPSSGAPDEDAPASGVRTHVAPRGGGLCRPQTEAAPNVLIFWYTTKKSEPKRAQRAPLQSLGPASPSPRLLESAERAGTWPGGPPSARRGGCGRRTGLLRTPPEAKWSGTAGREAQTCPPPPGHFTPLARAAAPSSPGVPLAQLSACFSREALSSCCLSPSDHHLDSLLGAG